VLLFFKVAFLRQPNITDILKERFPSVGTSQSLKDRIMTIRTEGLPALERLVMFAVIELNCSCSFCLCSRYLSRLFVVCPRSNNRVAKGLRLSADDIS